MDKKLDGQTGSVEQKAELEKARSELKAELNKEDYQTLLDLISRPFDAIREQLTKITDPLPYWIPVLLIGLLVLGLSFDISSIFSEVQDTRTIILEIGNVLVTILFIILVKSYFDKFRLGFQKDLIDYISSKDSLGKLKTWFVSTTARKPPLICGLLFGIVLTLTLAFYIPTLVYHTEGGFIGWGPLVLFFLANFTIGTGGYYLWISRNFRVVAKSMDFVIYEPNPSRSIVIAKLSKLLSIPVTIGALLSALTTLVFSMAGALSWVTLLIVIISGWYPMLSLFIRNHDALGTIITRAKDKKLSELQTIISRLQTNGLRSSADIEYLQKLIQYHDSIADTPNTALNVRVYFGLFNSLLLPLVTFFLSNLDVITKLFP